MAVRGGNEYLLNLYRLGAKSFILSHLFLITPTPTFLQMRKWKLKKVQYFTYA